MCPFPATARQPAQSAFPYVTLVESTGAGKLDASVQGATVPRKGLSPPDSCIAIDCQRTFFRLATRTPSHAANSRGNWACRWGRIELVSLYLERGADALEADAERWATLWHGLRSAGITRLSSCSARMAQGDLSDQSPSPGRPVNVQIPSPVAFATTGGI